MLSDDEKQWLDWQREDVVRSLEHRGRSRAEAQGWMDALPDEVFQIIRSKAVNELAECYITGMRATVRIREVLKYAGDMLPDDTERAVEHRRKQNQQLAALSRRDYPQTTGGGSRS
jgi:hypothetical protein